MPRVSRGDRGSAEDGVGVRPRRGRREGGGAGLEAPERPGGELAVCLRSGDAEPVEGAAVRVVRSDPVGETAGSSGRAAVVEAAVGHARLLEEATAYTRASGASVPEGSGSRTTAVRARATSSTQ